MANLTKVGTRKSTITFGTKEPFPALETHKDSFLSKRLAFIFNIYHMLKIRETLCKTLHVCMCVLSGLNTVRGDKTFIAGLMPKPYILAMSMSVPAEGHSTQRKKRSPATEPTCDECVTFSHPRTYSFLLYYFPKKIIKM